ncbi:MAG TPA: YtxH domain-containing protein [Candidatus Dormibacteraeota bacterium]|nr:YtxH domain-containing protein [Candidatus Dormibacteraeota bacterium]
MNDHGYRNDVGEQGATGITLTGFLIGAIFGAGVALLLAPGAGSETRRKVREAARKLGTAANEAMSHVREGDFGGRESESGFRGGPGDESFRSGGRRDPMPGARTPQPGTSGAAS